VRALFLGDYYPPLMRLPGVAALWAGGGYRAMLLAQALVWAPLLGLGTWLAARRVTSEWGATFAVALVFAAAGVVDAMHRFEGNLGATAAAAGCLAAWLWSDGLRDRRMVAVLGVCLALGLMVDRLGALPVVALPVAWTAWQGRADRQLRRNVAGLAVGLLVAVGWWYGLSARGYLAEWGPQLLAGEVGADGQELEESLHPLLWLVHYKLVMLDSQVGLIGGLLFIASLGWGVTRWGDERVRAVFLWAAVGLAVFTLIPKRQPFYTLPLLPAFAVLAAAMVCGNGGRVGMGSLGVPGARWRAVLAGVLGVAVTVPAVVTARPGEGMAEGVGAWLLEHRSPLPEEWVGERFPLASRPDGRTIEVLALNEALRTAGVGEEASIAILCADGIVDESQLLSAFRIARRSADVHGVVLYPGAIIERPDEIQALIDLRPTVDAWPDDAAVIDAHERRYGWEDRPELLAAMRRIGEGMEPLTEPKAVGGGQLRVWVRE